MSSFGVSFDVNKFIQAKIMQLVEPANPKNIRFTPEFESTVESKCSKLHDIRDASRNVALVYANKSGIRLTQIEIYYAADLYMGINPWTRFSSGTNSKT